MRCVVWFRRSFLSCILLVFALVSTAPLAQSGLQYKLGPGDNLRVTVFGEEDLSGEFEVDGNGRISMPLIDVVDLQNRSLRDAEAQIVAMLLDGYLRNPKVSVDVLNYRPFYILGEVNEPGSYPYRAGMTVLNAVVLAGGYRLDAAVRCASLVPAQGVIGVIGRIFAANLNLFLVATDLSTGRTVEQSILARGLFNACSVFVLCFLFCMCQ